MIDPWERYPEDYRPRRRRPPNLVVWVAAWAVAILGTILVAYTIVGLSWLINRLPQLP